MKSWYITAFISALAIAVPFRAALAQSAPNLGTAGNFAVLAGTTVTCTGGSITGDVGVNIGGSVGACTVVGTIHEGDGVAVQAYSDFLTAYASLAPQSGDVCTVVNGTLAGLTLPPGVYCLDNSAKTGVLTLNGPSDGIWIFKSGTSGTGALTGTSFDVVMAGGGSPCANGARVFWWSAQAATLTDSNFIGTVLAGTSITVTNGNFNGQALAKGAVTLTNPGSFSLCGNATPCTPPGAFTLLTPVNGAVNQSATNLLLDWTDSAGASTYNLYLGTANPPSLFQQNIAVSQFTVPVLTQGTTYYWTVTAANGCLPDSTAAVWSFTTGTPCTSPGAFTLSAPVNGAINQSTTNLLIDWTDSAGAGTYNLYLGTAIPPPLFQGGLAVSQLTVPVLTQNTTYYWTVTAANGCLPDASTPVWSFITGIPCTPPEAPQLKSPANGATDVSVPVTLTWYAAANAASYEVYLGLQPTSLTLIGTTTGLSYVVTGLSAGTTYYWMISAKNDCGFAHSPVWSFTTAGTPPSGDNDLFIVAACTSGAANSNWATDTMIFNATDHIVPYHFLFTPGGQDGTATPYDFAGTINPGQSVVNLNILESLYGLSNSAGNLRLVTDDPLYLTSRTYNLTDAGTYGQFIASLHSFTGVGNDTLPVGEKGQLLGVQQSDAFRTNLGVMEVMGKSTAFTITFYSAAGLMIGSASGTVEPYSWWQKNLIELGVTSGDDLRAEVEVTSGGAVLAYASVVDARTNDAYFVPAQKVSDMALVTHQLVAAIAKAKGGQGTDWRSDVYLYNPTTAAQGVTLQFYSNEGPVSNFVEVPAGENVAVTDIVSQLFSQLTGDVSGSLQLTSAAGLLAISNSFNLTENGTYGQFVPAKSGGDMLGINDVGNILQLSSNAAYRCNIGFSEYSGVATWVQLILLDTGGQQLGLGTFQVAPFSNLQLNDVFQMLNIPGNVDAARAQVKVISANGGSIYAYASVVDNRTGDAIFVPAQK